MRSFWSLRGFGAVFYKELLHIVRDPVTLRFVLLIPVLQLLCSATQSTRPCEHVPAIVYNGDRGRAARAFIDALAGSQTFDIAGYVNSRADLRKAIVAGKVRVGVRRSGELHGRRPGRTETGGRRVD